MTRHSHPTATAAVNRFGLGASPGELARAADPQTWLAAQITSGAADDKAFAGLPSSLEYMRREAKWRAERRAAKGVADPARRALLTAKPSSAKATTSAAQATLDARREHHRRVRASLAAEAAARFGLAAQTTTPFAERLVYFWSNHFAVSIDKRSAQPYAAPMEREAIRPHLTGRFADMLLAAETHPAMLRYLDNVRSIGPDSRLGEAVSRRLARKGDAAKGKAGGLNENLGREIMELHTLGVDGGYTQADVTELSRALTGWSTPALRDFGYAPSHRHRRRRRGIAGVHTPPTSTFVFREAAHEPGARRLLGKRYAAGGFEQGKAMLLDLARHPATAHHLAFQLARHFVADQPPPALVARMAQAYLDHDTSLAAVYRVLIASDEAWSADARKFKTPQDFVISALRAGSIRVGQRPKGLLGLLAMMGEPWFTPRSPAGFADVAANWIGADALWKRIQAAEALARRVTIDGRQPLDFARSALGADLDAESARAIRRAESIEQAVATLFACPAFQWRT